MSLLRASKKPSSAASETEQLFGENRDSLVRYLRYHLDDQSEAEDIVQETFVRFSQARSRDEEIAQPRAWLYRVAHNLLVDYGRKRKPDLLDEQGWVAVEGHMVVEANGLTAKAEVSKAALGSSQSDRVGVLAAPNRRTKVSRNRRSFGVVDFHGRQLHFTGAGEAKGWKRRQRD